MAERKAWWAFAGVVGMWGTSFLFIKLGLQDLEPFTLVAFRTGFATLSLGAVLYFTGMRLPRERHSLRLLAMAGVLNPAVPYVLITWGQQFVSSSIAGIINATVPLFTLPLAHFALRDERITPASLGGLALGFCGILLIFSPDLAAASSSPEGGAGGSVLWGQAAMVAAAICYAASMVFVRRTLRDTPPGVVAGASQAMAFILTAAAALVLEAPIPGSIGVPAWGVVAWLGISSGLSYLLFYYVLGRWGTTRTSLVTYLVPLVAVLSGMILLGEKVTWQALTGGLLVISGVVMINNQPMAKPVHSAQ